MYFDRNISEKGSYLSCVTNCEFHFITNLLIMNSTTTKFYTYSTKICTSGIRTSGDHTSRDPPVYSKSVAFFPVNSKSVVFFPMY